MPFRENYQGWWDALTVDQQTDAAATVGLLPAWMIDTLATFGIPTVVSEVDGVVTQLAPTSLIDFLQIKNQEPRNSL